MSAPVVLVVDDDPELRETLVDVFELAGNQVLSAEHGRAALELLQRAHDLPAVILLDLMMPVMNGIAFADELRKDPRLAELPIVLFTAHSDHERVAAEVQAAASLAKPLKLEPLLSVVGTVAQRSKGRLPSPEPA
jgi:two-component system, chemotaxis family, chemotaxis protein CheY